ncbi:exopolyphosphatase [Schizosaccharomyces cryophilus OY26]|uniref:Exopolyphosphatase n=1 Tax=Schizosaccharomyces cryophilus (strain OY26 / ATCC MYA-4695 / CBS 11777 / NBRC 106824 / NRRL Y48691) TaxID=653667 RepID=S9X316_SCHCR|nr:exopolyphosphatase [Schizosaccharomyces cryophilus OY26]EPY51497.1 exopolyphosphatase [Schizosaccharomyces cryophilus OY26]
MSFPSKLAKLLESNYKQYFQIVSETSANLQTKNLTFVSGNESADLDSCATSIVYAYFLQHKLRERCVVPFFNIPKNELRLRPELLCLLDMLKLHTDNLIFLNEVATVPERFYSSPIHLVDHNALDRKEVAKFKGSVEGVIDHHKDEGNYLHANPRIIKECGSCSTLVSQYFMDLLKSLHESTESQKEAEDIAVLALGPLLIDTGNLKNEKTTDTDVEVAEQLFQFVPSGWDRDEFFNTLKDRKGSFKGFSFMDLLHRDLKQYAPGNVSISYPSIGKGIDWIVEKRNNWQQELKEFAEEKQTDLVIIGLSLSKKEEFRRQMILYRRTKQGGSFAEKFLEKHQKDLGLELLANIEGNTIVVFNQRNSAASRKKVVPMIMDCI